MFGIGTLTGPIKTLFAIYQQLNNLERGLSNNINCTQIYPISICITWPSWVRCLPR